MRCAIIGAGFYGLHIANEIKKKFPFANFDIFEKEIFAMSMAATNNQARLHLGYHYPRSPNTIEQTISGFSRFIEAYASSVYFTAQNLYAVHKDSLIDFKKYVSIMDSFALKFNICDDRVKKYFKNFEDIDGVIDVNEGVIDLRILYSSVLSNINQNIHFSCEVTDINPEKGILKVDGKTRGPYDFIINTSYINPNLGLPLEIIFNMKYEIAAMVEISNPFRDNVAITIMDGNFVSLYPSGQGLVSISSVPFTPFIKTDSLSDLLENWKYRSEIANKLKVVSKITNHAKSFLNINDNVIHPYRLIMSPKAKFKNDLDANRCSEVRSIDKLICVFSGKLDAVFDISDQIISLIHKSK